MQKIFHFSVETELIHYKLKKELGDVNTLRDTQNQNVSSLDEDIKSLDNLLSEVTKILK